MEPLLQRFTQCIWRKIFEHKRENADYITTNVGFGDLERKMLILREDCDLFHGENQFEMNVLDPEICIFENTCFIQGCTILILIT